MLVTLDRAIPAGPWAATIVLRSGTTERTATAEITFPDEAASASEPVATGASGGNRLLLGVAGVVALVGVLAAASVIVRRRRRAAVVAGTA